jgi:SdrD B-like domain
LRGGSASKYADYSWHVGLPGWTIKLAQNGMEILNTTTDDRGEYSFLNLMPGTYEVTEESINGWSQTALGGGRYLVTLTDKPASRLDFGNSPSNTFYTKERWSGSDIG